MPRQVTKPIFPVQHEFLESLKRYQGEVAMLVSMVEVLVDAEAVIMPEPTRNSLRLRIAALRAATHD